MDLFKQLLAFPTSVPEVPGVMAEVKEDEPHG